MSAHNKMICRETSGQQQHAWARIDEGQSKFPYLGSQCSYISWGYPDKHQVAARPCGRNRRGNPTVSQFPPTSWEAASSEGSVALLRRLALEDWISPKKPHEWTPRFTSTRRPCTSSCGGLRREKLCGDDDPLAVAAKDQGSVPEIAWTLGADTAGWAAQHSQLSSNQ